MLYTADYLIFIALQEEGYFEKLSAKLLDDKTANAGSGNFTKYARDLHEAGYYNGSKQGVAWCGVFVDWCHYKAAGGNKTFAQWVSCQSGPYGAGCGFSMGYYQAAGRFFTENPMPGDQIYFGTAKSVDHTGIVTKVENGRVYTVEGNTSSQDGVVGNGGGVFQKSYPLNHSRILGYGRPRYGQSMEEDTEDRSPTDQTSFFLEMTVLKRGMNQDPRVKALQILLIGNGCTCGSWGADGNFGAATEMAVKNYQRMNHLQVDGMAGPETWGSLLAT